MTPKEFLKNVRYILRLQQKVWPDGPDKSVGLVITAVEMELLKHGVTKIPSITREDEIILQFLVDFAADLKCRPEKSYTIIDNKTRQITAYIHGKENYNEKESGSDFGFAAGCRQ